MQEKFQILAKSFKLEMIFGDTLPEKVLFFLYNFWKYIHVETSGKIRIKANLKPYAKKLKHRIQLIKVHANNLRIISLKPNKRGLFHLVLQYLS